MNNIKTSFLFFFILTLFGSGETCNSQTERDSLIKYANLINDAKFNDDLVDAISFFQKKKKLKKINPDTLASIYCLTNIAKAQKIIGALHDSEDSAIAALKLLDGLGSSTQNDHYQLTLYNLLGNIENEFKNYDLALKHYNTSLHLNKNPTYEVTILNNIGVVYKEKGESEQAMKYLNDAYEKSLTFKTPKVTARALDNLSSIQSNANDINALSNLLEALKIREDIEHLPGILTSYLNLGAYYKNLKDTKTALKYAQLAVELAHSTGNIDYKINALSFYAQLNADSKIPDFIRLRDSVDHANSLILHKYASEKYNLEKQEKKTTQAILKLKESEIDLANEKSDGITFIAIAAITLLSSIFLFLFLKTRHKKEKIQQVYNTEIRISRKIHDEVANDVYHVMTRLQDQPEENKTLLDDLENIYNRTRDISKENSTIDVSTNYQELLIDLFLSYNSKDVNVMTKDLHQIDWNQLNNLKKSTMYRVFQELLTNMKKHSKASVVVFNFGQEHKKITVNYKDNGIGSDLKKGNGLQNTVNRMESINGTITFESEVQKGFKVIIII
jgi:signal transduction histidine kinase